MGGQEIGENGRNHMQISHTTLTVQRLLDGQLSATFIAYTDIHGLHTDTYRHPQSPAQWTQGAMNTSLQIDTQSDRLAKALISNLKAIYTEKVIL